MRKENKPDCRPSHCENHHQGWTRAGILVAAVITAITIYKCGGTDLKFPERYVPQNNNSDYQSNEVDLLRSHLTPGPLYQQRRQ